MHVVTRAFALVPVALLAGAAGAQSAPSPDTIDVIGRKAEEVRKEAQEFVRATRVAEGEQPVARWVDPVCVRAIGVPDEVASRVEHRVREIAKAARVRLAKPRCTPNLTIAFTDSAGKIARWVGQRSQTAFENITHAEREQLYRGAAPIRWWHTVEMRSSDGMRSMGNDVPPAARLDGIGSVALGGQVIQQYRPSFLRTQVVRALTSASVVIDVKLAQGKLLDSVADYAALVGLAEIRPADSPPAASILSLFSDRGPAALTALDSIFLRTLYRLPLDRTALAQRGLLVRGLTNPAAKDD